MKVLQFATEQDGRYRVDVEFSRGDFLLCWICGVRRCETFWKVQFGWYTIDGARAPFKYEDDLDMALQIHRSRTGSK